MRTGYVVNEVLTGLRRNITMTIAMILTTAISLGLLGGGLIIAKMTEHARQIFGDRVEVTVYLTEDVSKNDPNCQQAVCQALKAKLQKDADVESTRFETQADALAEYKVQFAGQPEMLDIVSQDALPASFHVKLHDPQRFAVIYSEYATQPGVKSVNDQRVVLERLFSVLNSVRNATIIIAIVQAFAALLLISNMVQIAAFTRRTETSIMRLVGASRWRTQLPFMIEAVVAGIIGAVLAVGGLIAAKFLFVDKAMSPFINAGILTTIDTATLTWVAPILGAAGIGLAAVSAYLTLRLYVRL